MSDMVCQHCGQTGPAGHLGGYKCSKSPTGTHVIIARHDGNYTCQHCGQTGPVGHLGGYSCSKSPTGTHVII